MRNDNYPPGVTNLPADENPMKEYELEVGGLIYVEATGVDSLQDVLNDDIRNILYENYMNGKITVERTN